MHNMWDNRIHGSHTDTLLSHPPTNHMATHRSSMATCYIPWPKITLSTLLRSETITPPDNNPQEDQNDRNSRTWIARARGACRLLQILLSEGTHLIWVLRCERVIKDTNHWHPEEEIHTHWLQAINLWLTKDKLYATKIKCNKDTYQLVKNTWQPVLQQIRNLPNNWVHHSEVSVG